ncbi:hypothetical protein ABPG72_018228 [Tetrahymena utriculariae]
MKSKGNKGDYQLQLGIIIPNVMLIIYTYIGFQIIISQASSVLKEIKANMLIYEQQQQSSIHNGVSLQVRQSLQDISWSVNIANLMNNKIKTGQVLINTKYVPAVMNLQLAFNKDKSQEQLLGLFLKNNLLTTAWIQKDSSQLAKLDQIQKDQIHLSSILDPFIKAIKYSNNQEVTLFKRSRLQIQRTFLGFDYDGMLYSTSFTLTEQEIYEVQQQSSSSYFQIDIREQNFYRDSMRSELPISNQYISSYNQVINTLNIGLICQQSGFQKNNLVLCSFYQAQDYDFLGKNMGKSMQYYFMIEPNEKSIIYHSDFNSNSQSIQLEDYLKSKYDLETANNLLDVIQNQIQQNQNQSQLSSTNISLLNDTSAQYIYQFEDQNGKQLTAIINSLYLISKKPSDKKYFYQCKSLLFIQIFNQGIMETAIQDKFEYVKQYILYSQIALSIILALSMIISVIFSFKLKNQFYLPITHLTKVLKKLYKFLSSTNNINTSDEEIIQLIDGENAQNLYFMSKDTELLYISFKGLFQTLNATNNKLLKLSDENQCKSLMKLINQSQYFEKFGNISALGVCHNNIACIHMNQGRFLEALQHFSISIIQAQYELDFYKDKAKAEQESIISQSPSTSPRRSIQRQTTYFNNLSKQKRLIRRKQHSFFVKESKSSLNQETETNHENEKQELQYLYQKLFNRKFNYINALILLIRNQSIAKYTLSSLHLTHQNQTYCINSCFLDEVDELLLELLIIEQYLQKSESRTLQILLTRAQVKLDLNKHTEAKQIINECKQLFLETQQNLMAAVGIGQDALDNCPSPTIATPKKKTELNLKGQLIFQQQTSIKLNTPQQASSQNKVTSFIDEVNEIKLNTGQKGNPILMKKGNLKKKFTLQKQGSIDRREIDWMINKSKNQLQVRESTQSIFSSMNEPRRFSRLLSNVGQHENTQAQVHNSKYFSKISEIDIEDKEPKTQIYRNPPFMKIGFDFTPKNNSSFTQLQINQIQMQQQDSQICLNPLNLNTGLTIQNSIHNEQQNKQGSFRTIAELTSGYISTNNNNKEESITQTQIGYNAKFNQNSQQEINQINNLQKSIISNSQNSSLDINYKPIIRNLDIPIHLPRQKYPEQNNQLNISPSNNYKNSNINFNISQQEEKYNQNNSAINQQIIQNNHIVTEKISKVKRQIDDEKMIKFEFFPDILRTQLVLVEADLLISKQMFLKAAELLTKNLECSQFYTSHLRSQLIEKLTYIFEISNIESDDLKEFHQSFNINLSFKIALISASIKSSKQKRTYLFCKDILDEIMSNQNDKFGLIVNNSFLPVSLQIPLMKINQIKLNFHQIKLHLKQIYREIYKLENPIQKCFQRRSCRKGSSLISQRMQTYLQNENNSIIRRVLSCFKKIRFRNSNQQNKIFKQRSNQIKKSTIIQNQLTKNQFENESMDINFITEMQSKSSQNSESCESIQWNAIDNAQKSQIQQKYEQTSNSQNGSLFHMQVKQSKFIQENTNISNMNSNLYSPKILNLQRPQRQLSIYENQRLETSDDLTLKNKSLLQSPMSKQNLIQSYNINQVRKNSILKAVENLIETKQLIEQIQIEDENQSPKSYQNQSPNQINQACSPLHIPLLNFNFKPSEQNISFNTQNLLHQASQPLIQLQPALIEQISCKKQNHSPLLNQIVSPKFLQNRQKILRNKHDNFNSIFHFCVRKSIIDIILNGNMQNKDYLISQKIQEIKNEEILQKNQNQNINQKSSIYQQNYLINQQKIIVFVCDEQKKLNKDQKYRSLIKLLYSFKILLIVLQLNEKESQKEKEFCDDEYFNKTQVIMFFYSEDRLLQYLYNKRDKPICNTQPLIYEHFQTVSFIIILKF